MRRAHDLAVAVTATVAMATASLSPSLVAAAGDWQKISDEDGIVVYKKDLAGSEVISLRGETTIDASIDHIFEVMKDNATAHEWMPMVRQRRDLVDLSSQERVELTHLDMPWPATDRYFVAQARADRLDDGVLRLSTKSVDNAADYLAGSSVGETDGKVLATLHLSEFHLTPIDGGRRTRMTLEVNSDPRGLLPKWIVNVAQKSWPRRFFMGLRDQLAKRGWLDPSGTAVAH